MRHFISRTWFITGTSSGFGKIMTEKLLQRGDRVVATLRTPDPLDGLKQRYGQALEIIMLDITDSAAIRTAVDAAFQRMGQIDAVVSNAGYGLFGAAEELGDDQIRQQIDTNLIGSIQLIRAVLPHLRAQGGGRIIQVSSEGGQIAYPNFSLYHATKWGIEGFVEAVSQEVAPFGIAFTLAEPGPATTDFGKGLVSAPVMDIYDATPAGDVRRGLANGSFVIKGDPEKMAKAMIDSLDITPAPKRLAMGGSSYNAIKSALTERLVELERHKHITQSTDMDD